MQKDYLQMRVLEVAPQVFASGQLFVTDLDLIAKQGVRSIVCVRPDGEAPDQPLAVDLASAAEEHGIAFAHFPLDYKTITAEIANEFMQTCDRLKRPMLVCGRSGAHSTRAWETAESM
jgi:sulfide:quinone oxidoreductase